MAFGTLHVTTTELSAASRIRSNSAFIRELWTDEIIAAYKSNLVMPALVVNMPFVGRKGDTFHVPTPGRGVATAKSAEAMVTLQAAQETKKQYVIDQHYEYSRLIEDIASIQADDNVRKFYTDDAGYALAKLVDTALHAEGAKLAGNDSSPTVEGTAYSKAVIGSDGSTVWDPTGGTSLDGNAAALADAGIREIIRQLDDNDVPNSGRVLVIPPVEKKSLTGIARFTEQAFVGEGDTIRNGKIGNLYGVDVFVSTNCPTVNDANTTPNADQRACLLFQKEALVFIEQLSPRVQTSYIQEYLADLFTADTIYGSGVLRPEAGIAIVVPA